MYPLDSALSRGESYPYFQQPWERDVGFPVLQSTQGEPWVISACLLYQFQG